MAKQSSKPKAVKVDDYPERPLKEALDPDRDKVREQVDQIEDYHKTHPTLKTDGPEHDPEVQEKVIPDPKDPQGS